MSLNYIKKGWHGFSVFLFKRPEWGHVLFAQAGCLGAYFPIKGASLKEYIIGKLHIQ